MHFDALFGFVVARFVSKICQVEIGAELAIDSDEEVEIEGRRDAEGVIVRRYHSIDGLDKICAKQEKVAGS